MSLVTYDPWNAFTKLHDEVNRVFHSRLANADLGDTSSVATSNWHPAVDIEERSDRFIITADVPGVAPEDIEITMENGILSIQGSRDETRTVDEDGFKRTERVSGTFHRRFSLPDSADAERVSATGDNGVLTVEIPKGEKAKARRITVNG